jgi:ketosteroid isomerase-like protein
LINGPGSHAHIQHVRAFFQAFQSGDWADLDKMVRPDITVFAFGDGKKFKGSEALLAVLSDEHSAFAGQVEIEEIVAVGSYVAALVKISGQLRHDHGPLKAGRPFTERGIDIFRFQDGRIKVWRNYRNLYDLIEQLSEPIKPTPASGT